MKQKMIAFLVMLLVVGCVFAQNRLLDFQGMAFDSDGKFLANTNITVKFTIYDINEPSVNYVEEKGLTTDGFGVFKTLVGQVTNFESLGFSSRNFWLKVEAKKTGVGETFVVLSNARLAAVPYAKSAGDGLPVGGIVPFATTEVPHGWLPCNGQAVSRADYPALFALIGTTYGAGNGTTTFNLPNLRNRVAVGAETGTYNLASTGGAKTHTLTEAQMPSHTHGGGTLETNETGEHSHTWSDGHTSDSVRRYGGSNDVKADSETTRSISTSIEPHHTHPLSGSLASTGNGQAFNIMQPYLTIQYMIRAF